MTKKALIFLMSILILSNTITVFAKGNCTTDLAEAIKVYKTGNYSESYMKFSEMAKKDIGNPVVYYYLAISAAQVGKNEEAIANYNKVITLSPQGTSLYRYASKGKSCLESKGKCTDGDVDSKLDSFIMNNSGKRFSDEVKADFERLKIENLMREMNRSNNIEPQRFKEYKDFSSKLDVKSEPTNDEIVAALRVLQNAGLTGYMNHNLSYTGSEQQFNSIYGLMGESSLNPQLIQSMLTNNMSLGF